MCLDALREAEKQGKSELVEQLELMLAGIGLMIEDTGQHRAQWGKRDFVKADTS